MTPCSLARGYQSLGGIFFPWRYRHCVPPKRWYPYQTTRCHKPMYVIYISVRSNLIFSTDSSTKRFVRTRFCALKSTQPLTEMSTWNLPGGKGRPAKQWKAPVSNFSIICGSVCGATENSVSFCKPWFPCGSMCLITEIIQHHVVKFSHFEFQQNLFNDLQDVWKSPFIAICKLGCIVDQYGWKPELPTSFCGSFAYRILTKSARQFMRYVKSLFLVFYIIQALLWFNMAENRIC
jgi:hypothetical protein